MRFTTRYSPCIIACNKHNDNHVLRIKFQQVIKERRELFQQEKEKNANQSAFEKLPNGGLDQDDPIDAPSKKMKSLQIDDYM